MKVSPIARWSDKKIDRYIFENDMLVNPLQYNDYPSINCATCTLHVTPNEDPRNNR